MKWEDYRKRLGLSFDDCDRVRKCKNMVENDLHELNEKLNINRNLLSFWNFDYRKFLDTAIISINDINHRGDILDFFISVLEEKGDDFHEYVALFVLFLNCIDNDNVIKNDLKTKFIRCFKESGIHYDIVEDEDGIFLFPGGAKELDDSLVSEPLDWLAKYKEPRAVFVKALEMYSNNVDYDARTIADQFRKALEAFFQEFFGSSKSLENYKSEYGDYLKNKGVPAEIANNFTTLLQAYTNYMNNYVKHQDKTSENILEYIMYQTGNIIRLMIKLNES